MISDNLKWDKHVNFVYKKAVSRSYNIMKSFATKNIWTLKKLFTTYIRPTVEYNTCVWSPYLKKDVYKIECVQKQFTRWAFLRCGIPFTSYEDRLAKIGLQSLEDRRIRSDLKLMFRIVYGLVDLKFDDFFCFNHSDYQLRGNRIKIFPKARFSNTQWNGSFFVRGPKFWNVLPHDIVSSITFQTFESKLNRFDFSKFHD